MTFSRRALDIDPAKTCLKIEEMIRTSVYDYYKGKGIVIGLSGGLDSAVSASLSVRAIGANKVLGLLLPEIDSNPVSREYGALLAEKLGIEHKEIDISPYLEAFGVYEKRNAIVRKLFPDIAETFKFRLVLPQNLLEHDRINAYSIEVLLEDGTIKKKRLRLKDYLELVAANDIKQRTRMIQLYYEAERRHYVVCGTTNLSETIQGFFVKYGDGGVDIEPLGNLYKKQVYDLGRYLGVPEEILSRTPSPDTYSYAVSDEDFYFCMPYEKLDYILYGMMNDVPKKEVAAELGLTTEQIERAWKDLAHKYQVTRHLRELPPAVKL